MRVCMYDYMQSVHVIALFCAVVPGSEKRACSWLKFDCRDMRRQSQGHENPKVYHVSTHNVPEPLSRPGRGGGAGVKGVGGGGKLGFLGAPTKFCCGRVGGRILAMVLLLVAGMVTFQKHATITRRRLFSDTEKKFQEIRRVQEQKEAGSMDSGVPPEFRGDWRRIGAARGGDGAVAEVHPDSKAKLQKEIEKMLSESSAAQVGVSSRIQWRPAARGFRCLLAFVSIY